MSVLLVWFWKMKYWIMIFLNISKKISLNILALIFLHTKLRRVCKTSALLTLISHCHLVCLFLKTWKIYPVCLTLQNNIISKDLHMIEECFTWPKNLGKKWGINKHVLDKPLYGINVFLLKVNNWFFIVLKVIKAILLLSKVFNFLNELHKVKNIFLRL